jgi:hypothetical protein
MHEAAAVVMVVVVVVVRESEQGNFAVTQNENRKL